MFTHTGTTVSIARTTVSGNSTAFDGGGIFAIGTSLSIADSTLENNRANHSSSDGGALFASNSSQVTIERSLFTGNFSGFAGGGVSSFSVVGTNPLVAANNSLAFPLKLAWNATAAIDFVPLIRESSSVPEPSSIVVFGAALIGFLGWRRRPRHVSA